jgi:hypothetical protein
MSLIEDCAGLAGVEPQTWGTGRQRQPGDQPHTRDRLHGSSRYVRWLKAMAARPGACP